MPQGKADARFFDDVDAQTGGNSNILHFFSLFNHSCTPLQEPERCLLFKTQLLLPTGSALSSRAR